jgi:hypothetical protein
MTGANASDAAGNFPRFYIAAGTYKLRAETSAGVLIWQYDNIDTGLSAGSGALPVASGGTGGTTATAARTNLDVPSNADLTTLTASLASSGVASNHRLYSTGTVDFDKRNSGPNQQRYRREPQFTIPHSGAILSRSMMGLCSIQLRLQS